MLVPDKIDFRKKKTTRGFRFWEKGQSTILITSCLGNMLSIWLTTINVNLYLDEVVLYRFLNHAALLSYHLIGLFWKKATMYMRGKLCSSSLRVECVKIIWNSAQEICLSPLFIYSVIYLCPININMWIFILSFGL